MPSNLFASPYPALDLSLDEKEELHDLAFGLLDECQEEFENYLWKRQSTVDAARWNLLKEKEDVHVYVDKRPGAGTENKDMQLLLTVGTIKGTLHDAVYGEFNHNTDDIRIKTFYSNDTMLDGAVLSTILEPTMDQPFQSMSVRWIVKGIPLLLRAVAKHNDTVFIETTGIRELSNGDKVGFMLMHSVTFPKTPALPQYDRLNVSVRTLYRQRDADTVQVFTLMYLELKETPIVTALVLKSIADALLVAQQNIECSQLKKLARLVQKKATLQHEAHEPATLDGTCSVCGCKSRSARQGAKSSCAICRKATCKRCRIKRRMAVITPDRQLLSVDMRFCTPCIASAKQLDAFAFAQEEVIDARSLKATESFKSSSAFRTTSSSSSMESYFITHSNPSMSSSSTESSSGRLRL